jgi:hypothetical protein
VRVGAGSAPADEAREWARARRWPEGTVHALCAVLRSRGRTLGVVTFLRGAGRSAFERADATYAEDVAGRMAAALDLADLAGLAAGAAGREAREQQGEQGEREEQGDGRQA